MNSDAPVDDSKRELMAGLLAAGLLAVPTRPVHAQGQAPGGGDSLALPAPSLAGSLPLEQALRRRRSRRGFRAEPLARTDVAQLLWAAQGRTDDAGHRTAPSAGALYPLELTLVAGRVDGLAPAVYRYLPEGHALQAVAQRGEGGTGDLRAAVAAATRGQPWVAEAPLILVIAADLARTAARYGERAERYVAFEAGAAAQNVALQCTARGWATVPVGAFDESRLRAAIGLATDRMPLVLLPVGWPR